MENEFIIHAELLSFGGYAELTIIPYKRNYQVLLDDQELGTLHKNKDEQWVDLNGDLDRFSIQTIGDEIDFHYQEKHSLKVAS